jgi:hypothetical protein
VDAGLVATLLVETAEEIGRLDMGYLVYICWHAAGDNRTH